ncbi:hypothetical protein BH11BAC7_BH11BAC7_35170 [soil metagenome]
MKTIAFLLSAIVVLSFCSCEGNKKEQPCNLAGKVYMSSEGVDSTGIYIPKATDFYQTVIFINDSEFLHTINTCCGQENQDFAYEFVCKGKYKVDEKFLTLNFDPISAVCYSKYSSDLLRPDSTIATEYVKLEKSHQKQTKMVRMNCNNIPYFQDKIGITEKEFVSLTPFKLEDYRKALEKLGAWQTLFPQ